MIGFGEMLVVLLAVGVLVVFLILGILVVIYFLAQGATPPPPTSPPHVEDDLDQHANQGHEEVRADR